MGGIPLPGIPPVRLMGQWCLQSAFNEKILRATPLSAVARLRSTRETQRPAIIVLTAVGGVGLGAALLDPGDAWIFLILPIAILCSASWEAVRAACYASRSPLLAVLGNALFAVLQVSGTAAAVWLGELALVWVSWAVGAGVASWTVGRQLLRRDPLGRVERNSFQVRYAVDSVIGSGAGQVALLGAAAVLSENFVGAVRGATLLLGPIALGVAASRLVLVPVYARAPAPLLWVRTVVALSIVAVMWSWALTHALPWLGQSLLGETWPRTHQVFALVTCGFVAQTIFDTAFAYGRARSLDRACTASRLLSAASTCVVLAAMFVRPGDAVFLVLTAVLTATSAAPMLYALLGDLIGRPRPDGRLAAEEASGLLPGDDPCDERAARRLSALSQPR